MTIDTSDSPTMLVRLQTTLSGATVEFRPRPSIGVTLGGSASIQASLEGDDPEDSGSARPIISVVGRYVAKPEQIVEICRDALSPLRDATMRVIELVRWRLDPDTWSGDSIKGEGSVQSWSSDGMNWSSLGDTSDHNLVLVPSGARLSEESEIALNDLARSGAREPLGREIWHTGLGAHKGSDYRTSIILAVSSVEIGLKQFIIGAAPETEWLVTNAPSPPIFNIITEYLPELAAVDKAHLPSKDLTDTIRKAVKRRNDFVHVGIKPKEKKPLPDRDESLKDLGAASDMLWLLDYYQGHDWALENLGWAERQSLDYWFAPWKRAR